MNLMVIGGGGREHAIISKLIESPKVSLIYALPGNGGIGELCECVPIAATDIDAIVAFAAENAVDFAVVTPDDPLALGAVDALEAAGIPCFGPDKKAAKIESSKLFAKELMEKYSIPTARYASFSSARDAYRYLESAAYPIVVKADGLALGKGVTVAASREEATAAVRAAMEERVFGGSGERIIIEECLTGPEVSVLAFTDGETLVPMVSSMDHKRAHDGDTGPNTGGMGAIAPSPLYTDEIAAKCMERIFLPTVRAMAKEGRPFKGCLYFGLMLTPGGPKVIEYNCRFGDPETQAVLALLESDLLEIMLAVREGRLGELPVTFSEESACCVVLASGGYPGKYQKGCEITFGASRDMAGTSVFHAGTKCEGNRYYTSGGRVLGVTARRATLGEAVDAAYAAAAEINFDGAFYRHDIGKAALGRQE